MLELSVVIPTYNRLSRLEQVLTSLEKQTYPIDNWQVLVVSDGSTDGTNEYLHALDKPYDLHYIFQPNQGVAAARNNGIAHSEGRIILFIDDDVVPSPQLLAEHMRYHEHFGGNAVVIGPMLNPLDYKMSPWVRWEQDRLARQYHEMNTRRWEPTARQFYTGNTSLARIHLVESGGFDTQFKRAEDVELAYRLSAQGVRFLFNPQAIGHHYAARNFQSWLATAYAYGRNDVVFACQKGQDWLLGTIFEEFYTRHPLIRGLIKVCLDRPFWSSVTELTLTEIVKAGTRWDLSKLSNLACSGLFNLRYYQGVADGLSGREIFIAGTLRGATTYGTIN